MKIEVDSVMIEQFCADLNLAHDELMKTQGATREQSARLDWPEWTPQANSIRWAEQLLGKKLAKTDQWTLFPSVGRKAKKSESSCGMGPLE